MSHPTSDKTPVALLQYYCDMMATFVHDIRSPLSVIRTATYIILQLGKRANNEKTLNHLFRKIGTLDRQHFRVSESIYYWRETTGFLDEIQSKNASQTITTQDGIPLIDLVSGYQIRINRIAASTQTPLTAMKTSIHLLKRLINSGIQSESNRYRLASRLNSIDRQHDHLQQLIEAWRQEVLDLSTVQLKQEDDAA